MGGVSVGHVDRVWCWNSLSVSIGTTSSMVYISLQIGSTWGRCRWPHGGPWRSESRWRWLARQWHPPCRPGAREGEQGRSWTVDGGASCVPWHFGAYWRGSHVGECKIIRNRFLCSLFSVFIAQRVPKVRYSGPHIPLVCVQSVVAVTGKKSCSYSKL